ncbi:MAG: ATP-binding protein [Clostridia bacterium]|nr:ATP-binding protein [Clostridia bacterium]
MLLDFKLRNYRSFRDETVFSMEPTSPQRDLQSTLLTSPAGSWNYHANSLAVIYGPNAAGKTNLVTGLEAFRNLVLRGHIRNSDLPPRNMQGAAGAQLELMPNMHALKDRVTGFDIAFVDNGMLVEYGLDFDLGGFMNTGYGRRVSRESLRVNGAQVFSRGTEGTTWGDLEVLKERVPVPINLSPDEYALVARIAASSVTPDELLLANGFRSAVWPDLAAAIRSWFQDKLFVALRIDEVPLPKTGLAEVEAGGRESGAFRSSDGIRSIAEQLGLTARQLGFPVRDGEMVEELYTLLADTLLQGKPAMLPAQALESRGTIRLAHIIQAAAAVLEAGGILVADELDVSVHPAAMRAVMNLFHDEKINRSQAQLVFTTHNPAYLDSNLCRRDELRFVERPDDLAGSRLWSLADLGSQAGQEGEDYLREYLQGSYGAVGDLDLSGVFAAPEGQ